MYEVLIGMLSIALANINNGTSPNLPKKALHTCDKLVLTASTDRGVVHCDTLCENTIESKVNKLIC